MEVMLAFGRHRPSVRHTHALRPWLARNIAGVLLLSLLVMGQGLFFLQNVGPYSGPDPDLHASASYALATGQSFNRPVTVSDGFGNQVLRLPVRGDSRYLTGQLTWNHTMGDIVTRALRGETRTDVDAQRSYLSGTWKETTVRTRATQYSPVGYMPQAAGLGIAWGTGAGPYRALQCARLANLCAYLLVWSAAFLLAPKKSRPLLGAVACTPACCFMATSLGPDGMLTAATALVVSLSLRFIEQDGDVGTDAFALLCCATVFLVLAKPPYAACCLLVLVMPRAILPRTRAIAYLLTLGAACALYLLWHGMQGAGFYNASRAANTAVIRDHPLQVLATIAANTVTFPLAHFQTAPYAVIGLAAVTVFWLLRLHGMVPPYADAAWAITRDRYAVAALVAATATMVATVTFITTTWNDLTVTTPLQPVRGLQGRYILPLLPLLACLPAKGPQNTPRPDNV